jgi:NAD(P)-dependent dehydrogenase (short-subunit alcohol dehydrogenase family)
MEVDLAGRGAIVAGHGNGLGEASATALAGNGATVETVGEASPETLAISTARLGRLDILVTVALPASELSAASIEGFCRAAADAMSERSGRILNVVSVLGVIPVRGESAASSASAGIISLTKSLALEFGPRGILVNALALGAHAADAELAERLVSHVPLARPASLDEIAAAALFLVDPDNSYTTGHVLVVDGGWVAGYARNF